MLIGYARVSTADGSQSLDLQRDALQAAGVDGGHVYHDFRLRRPRRPPWTRQLRACAPTGDVLVVWKLDRLGRNLAHLVNTVQDLSTRGVGPDLPGFFGPLLTREWRPLDSFLTSRRLSVSAS